MSGHPLMRAIEAPAFGAPVGEWTPWFAWYPVRTWDGRLIWLSYVYRQLVRRHSWVDFGPVKWWQYHG
jgi:hypothetical protein